METVFRGGGKALNTAMLIDIQQQALEVKRSKLEPSKFDVLTRELHQKSEVVRYRWDTLRGDQKEAFRQFANKLTDSKIVLPISIFDKLSARISLLRIFLLGHGEAFLRCVDALDQLIDNVLDAMEREEHTYQEALSDTINSVPNVSSDSQALDVETGSGWLQQLSAQELEEV